VICRAFRSATESAQRFARPLVDEDRVVAGLHRSLLFVGLGLLRDEEDAAAVAGPLERANGPLVVAELLRLAAGRPNHPDLRAGVAVVFLLVACGQERHARAVRRPARRSVLVAREELVVIGAVHAGDPDRLHALVVFPDLDLGARVQHATPIGGDLRRRGLHEVEQVVDGRGAALVGLRGA
jgi:hypothetical protein